ncbi:sugar phosphate isomerase/epimerase family protein [Martelella sp. AMO21009]
MSDPLSTRLAVMNIHYFRHSLPHFLDDAAALGFSKIELWAGMPHLCLEDATSDDIKRTKQLLLERELALICLTPEQCLYPINLASEHPGTARRSHAYFLRALEVAEALECPQILVTAGWGYANQPTTEAWNRARDQLGKLAREAQRKGVTLLLEPLSKTESNLIVSSADLLRMMDEICSDQIAAILDLNAMAAAGETPDTYLTRFGDRLRHVHICDGTPEGHLAWGDGTLPLAEYIHSLEKSGYTGNYSFEFVSADYWLDPRTPLAHSRSELLQSI